MNSDQITAEGWFSSGTRVIYDPVTKKIVERSENANVAGEPQYGPDVKQLSEMVKQGWRAAVP